MGPSNDLEKKIASDTYCVVQLICMNIQTCNSSEQPLEDNQANQSPWQIKIGYDLLSQLGTSGILNSFKLLLEEKSRLELLESIQKTIFMGSRSTKFKDMLPCSFF